ncbi:MAG: hypothetical protein HC876_01605 [Chloroflexaceae bacterium]|nr:hypothetical protein [Chloroflexaceae bacterium]NJO04321.1 hypothetical protein [Chloroflexaceae bacterium]
MRNLVSQRNRLDDLFRKVESLPVDAEIQAHWARYLCVLVSGFLENAVYSIYSEYARKQSAPFVASYVEKQLSGFQNPNLRKILDLSGAFNPMWRTQIETDISDELKDAVTSIVSNRHLIAHGKNTDITFIQVRNHYQNILKLIDFLRHQCNV